MAKKASIKKVDREAAKAYTYAAIFGGNPEMAIRVNAADLVPGFMELPPVAKGLVFNGLTQKLNDSHAGADGDAKKAYEWTYETLTALREGKWTTRVPGEGGPRGGSLYAAIAEFRQITEDEARDRVAAQVAKIMDEAGEDELTEKAAFARVKTAILKKYPEVKEILDRMAAEKIEKTTTVEVDL